MKKRDVFDVKLDPEEQELLESVERGEWKTVDNLEEELAFAREAAANYFRQVFNLIKLLCSSLVSISCVLAWD